MSVSVVSTKGEAVYTKGAPDVIIGQCRYALTDSGVVLLSSQDKKRLMDIAEGYASKALRVMAFSLSRGSDGKVFIASYGNDRRSAKGKLKTFGCRAQTRRHKNSHDNRRSQADCRSYRARR